MPSCGDEQKTIIDHDDSVRLPSSKTISLFEDREAEGLFIGMRGIRT